MNYLSITNLNKSLVSLSKKLKKEGFEVGEIYTFMDDSKGGYYGGSYSEIEISKGDFSEVFRFYSKYGLNGQTEIAGDRWSVMKAYFLKKLHGLCELKND